MSWKWKNNKASLLTPSKDHAFTLPLTAGYDAENPVSGDTSKAFDVLCEKSIDYATMIQASTLDKESAF
jgi:hypothetical protein